MKTTRHHWALGSALLLTLTGTGCGSSSPSTTDGPAVSLALSTVSDNLADATVGTAELNLLRSTRQRSARALDGCSPETTGFTGCETELSDFAQKLLYNPGSFLMADGSQYSDNFLYLYQGNLFLACAAVVSLEAEATLDTNGYPENGNYTVSITGEVAQSLIEYCDVPAEAADGVVEDFNTKNISFITTVADASGTEYDKAITIDVTDEVDTKVEMLVSYGASGAKIFMKQQYKGSPDNTQGADPNTYNSSDIWVADFNKDSGLTRFEFVSPLQSSWTSGNASRFIRLLVNDSTRTAMGMQHFKPASGTAGTFTFAADESTTALSVKGLFSTLSGVTTPDWSNGKSACVNPAGTAVTTDQSISCGTVTGSDLTTPAAGTTTLIAAAEALAVGTTDTETVCPVDPTAVSSFTADTFFTAPLSICN